MLESTTRKSLGPRLRVLDSSQLHFHSSFVLRPSVAVPVLADVQ